MCICDEYISQSGFFPSQSFVAALQIGFFSVFLVFCETTWSLCLSFDDICRYGFFVSVSFALTMRTKSFASTLVQHRHRHKHINTLICRPTKMQLWEYVSHFTQFYLNLYCMTPSQATDFPATPILSQTKTLFLYLHMLDVSFRTSAIASHRSSLYFGLNLDGNRRRTIYLECQLSKTSDIFLFVQQTKI